MTENDKNLLQARQIMQSIQSNGFLNCFSLEDISSLALFLTYQVQRAFYEIIKGCERPWPWEEFVMYMRKHAELREMAIVVALHAVRHFDYGSLDFKGAGPVQYFEADGEEDMLHMSQIFENGFGEGLIGYFMLQAERAHYRAIACEKRPGYTWEAYLKDLQEDQAMLEGLSHGMQQGLSRMDFEKSWLAEDLEETAIFLQVLPPDTLKSGF